MAQTAFACIDVELTTTVTFSLVLDSIEIGNQTSTCEFAQGYVGLQLHDDHPDRPFGSEKANLYALHTA